jgi:hypothetical protein
MEICMTAFRRPHARPRMVALTVVCLSAAFAALSIGGYAYATASPSNTLPVSTARTPAWTNGTTVSVQYAQNYFCDRSVTAVPLATSGCEVGAAANAGPVANPSRSTLYVIVPLFANPDPATMCPTATGPTPPLNCPNHPQDIYVPLAGFGDIPLPAHSHILDGPAGGWWDVKVTVVLDQGTWAQIAAGKSLATLQSIEAQPDAGSHILFGSNLPSNLFLFFNTVK